jgi:hypothetical protein
MKTNYKFMSFKGPKNIIINGLLIWVGLSFIASFVSPRVMGARACKCRQTAGMYASTTNPMAKYTLPIQDNTPVVTRKSVSWYTAKN